MSILNVEHLSHGFGDRAIFQDVSFRLLKGEHIGLIGANGTLAVPVHAISRQTLPVRLRQLLKYLLAGALCIIACK